MRIQVLGTFVVPMALVATLAGCGGGDGGQSDLAEDSSVAKKYVGSWTACTSDPVGSRSFRATWQIAKVNDTAIAVSVSTFQYEADNCAGVSPAISDTGSLTATFVGTKLVESNMADLVQLDAGNSSAKMLLSIGSNGSLHSGGIYDEFEPKDPQGYPTRFNNTPMVKF